MKKLILTLAGAFVAPFVMADVMTRDQVRAYVPTGFMKIDADSYKSGMVFQYDGIRNAGLDKPHDSVATKWVNLGSGTGIDLGFYTGYPANPGTIKWGADHFEFVKGAKTYAMTDGDFTVPNTFTVQLAVDIDLSVQATAYPNYFCLYDTDTGCFTRSGTKQRMEFKAAALGGPGATVVIPQGEFHGQYLTAGLEYGGKMFATEGTSYTYYGASGGTTRPAKKWLFASGSGSSADNLNPRYLYGKFYSMRLYDRKLTDEEMEWNRFIDEARFHGAVNPYLVTVDSTDSRFSGNGGSGDFIALDGHVFTAEAQQTETGDTFDVIGYNLQKWDDEANDWGAAVLVEQAEYEYKENGGRVKITWVWAGVTTIRGEYEIPAEGARLESDVVVAEGTTFIHSSFAKESLLNVNGSVTVRGPMTVRLPEDALFDGSLTILRATELKGDLSKVTLIPAAEGRSVEVVGSELRVVSSLPASAGTLTISNTDAKHLINVALGTDVLVKRGSGVLTADTLALNAIDSVLVEQGTLALGDRTGGSQKWTKSVTVGPAPGEIIWKGIDLSKVSGISFETVSGSNWGVTDPEKDAIGQYFWTYADGVATVQLQQYSNDNYLKWVVLTFTQDGEDVRCATTAQCYVTKNLGKPLYETDLTGIDVGTDITATCGASAKVSKGAYKVQNVMPIIAGLTIENKIVVSDGARLDLASAFANVESLIDTGAIHGKTIYVEGNGPDGQGALYNSDLTPNWGSVFGRVVLTGNASVGGGYSSFRPLTGSTYEGCRLEGEYAFTVKSQALDGIEFTFYKTDFAVDRIVVETRARLSGALTGTVTNGIHLVNGASLRLGSGATIPAGIPLVIDDGAKVSIDVMDSAATLSAPLIIGEGAELTIACNATLALAGTLINNGSLIKTGSSVIDFASPCSGSGTVTISGGTTAAYRILNGALSAPPNVISSTGDRIVLLATQPTMIGSELDALLATTIESSKQIFCLSQTLSNLMTVENANWDVFKLVFADAGTQANVKLGAGTSVATKHYHAGADPNAHQSQLEIGEGASLTIKDDGEFWIGTSNNNGLAEGTEHHEVIVSGGTLTAEQTPVVVGHVASHAYLTMTNGTINAKTMQIRLGTVNYKLERLHDELYTQKGGTLNLGSGGFTTNKDYLKRDSSYLDLVGGKLVAQESFTMLPYVFYSLFGEREAGEYTIDLNGNTINWYNAIGGKSAVEVTGAGNFVTTPKVQNIATGMWTVNTEPGANVDLTGAAGFAGGVTLKADTSAQVRMGSTGTVELAFVYNKNLVDEAAQPYKGAFPYQVSTFDFIHERLDQNNVPKILKTNYSTFVYRGQFYVSSEQKGTWYFATSFDDRLALEIDGTRVVSNTKYTEMGYGQAELTEGWHDFMIYAWDNEGSAGPYNGFNWNTAKMGLGFSLTSFDEMTNRANPENYTRFDPTSLPMRACDPDVIRTTVRFEKTNRDVNTWDSDDCIYSTRREVLTSLKALRTKADAKNLWAYANSRLTGYFYLEDTAAYKFAGLFDDRMSLRIDGELIIKTTDVTNWKTKTIELEEGWHFFDIRMYDNGGDVGYANALKIQGGKFTEETPFDEDALRIVASLDELDDAPKGGLGGVTTLEAGSTLENTLNYGACAISGTIAGSGALKGRYAFVEGGSIGVTLAGRTAIIPDMSGVTNDDVYANLGKVEVLIAEKALRTKYSMGAAHGLTAEDAAKIVVSAQTADGTEVPGWKIKVEGDVIYLVNPKPQGTTIWVR